jgi:ABC-type phosphate transport system substrate-binding protein
MNKNKVEINRITITATFAILVVAVIVLSAAVMFLGGTLAHEKEARTWDTKLIYACYNNKIYPCNEDGVAKWNEQYPEKAITSEYLRNPNF